MKKIAFVINDNLIGGAQRLFIELANRFAHDQDGYEVHLVTCFNFGEKENLAGFIDKKVKVTEVSFTSIFDLKGWVRYFRFMKEAKPDHILSTLFFANTISRIASLFVGPRVIVVEQNTYDQKHPFFELVDRTLSRITPVIVCTSETVKTFTSAKEKIPAEKFLVIHSGVDSDKLISRSQGNTKEAQRDKLGIPSSAFVFLNTARLTPQKNHELLIEAFAEYSQEDTSALLLLVGDGGSAASLKDLVHAKGLGDKVMFTGSVQDIWNYYLAADVFISTSRIEGFSLVHAEAMVFGLPIITTRTAGPDVMVVEGENGLFVESNTASVVSAMKQINKETISIFSESSRKKSEFFDINFTFHNYKKLLDSFSKNTGQIKKIALMSYPMDSRQAKGTAVYTRQVIANLLAESRDDVQFSLVHYEKTEDKEYKQEKISEILMPTGMFGFRSRFIGQLRFFWEFRNKPFDTVVWFQPRLYPFFWLVPAKKKVAVFHGAADITAPTSFFSISREIFNWILKFFGDYLDVVIAVSEFGKREIIENYGIKEEKVHVTYNGGGENYKPLDKEASQDKVSSRYGIKTPYFLNISRFQPHKNVDRVVQAYEEFKDRHAESSQSLVLVGTPVRGYDLPIQLAKKSKFAQSIKIIDYVEESDLNDLYSGADVFLFPSLNEGFGLPLLEAMASGTPAVTSNVTSLPEISGGAAYCADPNDVSDIVQGIETALSPAGEDMKNKGIERSKNFTWKVTADTLLKLC